MSLSKRHSLCTLIAIVRVLQPSIVAHHSSVSLSTFVLRCRRRPGITTAVGRCPGACVRVITRGPGQKTGASSYTPLSFYLLSLHRRGPPPSPPPHQSMSSLSPLAVAVLAVNLARCAAASSSAQGLTHVHFSAHLKRFLWDRAAFGAC
jgi:hypothetical protein